MSIGLSGIRRRRMGSGVGVGVIRMCRRWRIRRGVVFRSGWRLRGGMLLLLGGIRSGNVVIGGVWDCDVCALFLSDILHGMAWHGMAWGAVYGRNVWCGVV